MITAQLPDGTKLEFPEGTGTSVIQKVVKERLGVQEQPQQAPVQEPVQQPVQQPQGFDKEFAGASVIEPAVSVASSVAAEPIAGLAGMVKGMPKYSHPVTLLLNELYPDMSAADAVEATRRALTFQPRTEAGKQGMQALGETLAPIGEAIGGASDYLGDQAYEATGSPALAAAAKSAPTFLAEMIGLKGIGGLKAGTRLKLADGEPTAQLKKALEKQGLNFDNLSEQTKGLIPEKIGSSILPAATNKAIEAERALKNELKSGSKGDSLAGLKLDPLGNIKPDKPALEAIRQGFKEGMVQTVKTASPQTKRGMRKMLKQMRMIKNESRLANDLRPSNVAGDALARRINFIRNRADNATIELDRIAQQELKGLTNFDKDSVLKNLNNELENLDIGAGLDSNGVLKPEFEDSIFSLNTSAQKAVKDAIRLLSKGGSNIDALRVHKLKRQFDDLIDFKKKGKDGLSNTANNFLKSIRTSLNESLKDASPNYARVNKEISDSLQAFENIGKAAGSIDIFGKGAGEALGTRLRALFSNQQSRVPLKNALIEIDDLVKRFNQPSKGIIVRPKNPSPSKIKNYEFNDSIVDLADFANQLDNRFGAVAETSMAGIMNPRQATEAALTQDASGFGIKAAAEMAGKGADKLRGVNDFNAFNAMEELLKR